MERKSPSADVEEYGYDIGLSDGGRLKRGRPGESGEGKRRGDTGLLSLCLGDDGPASPSSFGYIVSGDVVNGCRIDMTNLFGSRVTVCAFVFGLLSTVGADVTIFLFPRESCRDPADPWMTMTVAVSISGQ